MPPLGQLDKPATPAPKPVALKAESEDDGMTSGYPMNDEQSHERLTCGAKTRSGTHCKRAPVPGRNRCKLHGGATLQGAAVPHFKSGRYSKYMPGRLLERYSEFLADPEYMELRGEIAVIDVRLADLLTKIETGDTRTAWQIAGDLISDLEAAAEKRSLGQIKRIVKSLKDIFMKGLGEADTWQQILEAAEQRRKLVESEQKRLTAGQQMITAEQALALVMALQDSVRRHVTDRDILAAISADLSKLIAQPVG
jgi:hypothetical protein